MGEKVMTSILDMLSIVGRIMAEQRYSHLNPWNL